MKAQTKPRRSVLPQILPQRLAYSEAINYKGGMSLKTKWPNVRADAGNADSECGEASKLQQTQDSTRMGSARHL